MKLKINGQILDIVNKEALFSGNVNSYSLQLVGAIVK